MELGVILELQCTVLYLVSVLNAIGIKAQITPACHHSVFCNGQSLELVQLSGVFADSKEFVDRPLLVPPTQVQQDLISAFSMGGVATLKQTLLNLTSLPASDLQNWEPPDWNPRPSFIDSIQDSSLRQWAYNLNNIWKQLGRQTDPSVVGNPELHSLLPQPFPFIVPGGRFRESYYWDSFWVLHGLLLGGMQETAGHMIENAAALIHRYGFVPNGGRIYYTARSQPPLLTQMVALYYNFTSNLTFVETMLPTLSMEYDFWMTNRSVRLLPGTMNHYSSPTNTPRPESYVHDVSISAQLQPEQRPRFYSAIASAAESGWDFSSRWLERGSVNIASIRTQRILPVDLNAILCQNELTLHRFYSAVGNSVMADHYFQALKERQRFFDALFWSEERGLWFDRDLDSHSLLTDFYASSLVPLLWECNTHNTTRHEVTLRTLQQLGVLNYPGGIPASLVQGSEEQWDFPNSWAPCQWFLVAAWTHSELSSLRQAAKRVAMTWIKSTYSAWTQYNHTMFEKYLCTASGHPGDGGEYAVQSGFGWTNAVVLSFLWLYPDLSLSGEVSSTPDPGNDTTPAAHQHNSFGWIAAPIVVLVVAVVVVMCGVWSRWLYRTGERRYWRRVHNEHLRGGDTEASAHGQRDSSEETEESVDNDRKELFSWNL